MRIKTVLIAVIGIVAMGLSAGSVQAAGNCDRPCLEAIADKYLDAVVAHDPSRAPIAKTAKFTENAQRLEVGDGLWNTATGKGTYKMYLDDTQAGQVLLYTTIREADMPAILVARLEVKNGMITEIETEVSRTVPGATNLEKMGGPRQAFLQDLPPEQRVSREGLVRIANMYFTGLEKNDGKGEYPFGDDCDRIENGNHTTNNKSFTTGSGFANGQGAPVQGGAALSAPAQAPVGAAQSFNPQSNSPINPASMGCLEQFKTGYFHFVTRIRDRRYVVVDTQKGVAFGFVFFDHAAGNSRTFQLADGREITTGPVRPWTWKSARCSRSREGRFTKWKRC